MSQILFHITTNAFFSTISSSSPGGMLQSTLEETTCFTTSSLRPFCGYGCYRRLSLPTTITAEIWIMQGTSEIAWKGRIRLMTATLTYANAFPVPCLAGRLLVAPHHKFRLPTVKARYRNLTNSRTTTREKGNDFQGWAIYTDGEAGFSEGETSAGWGAVARSPHGRLYIMFGPVITTEAHLAHAGAKHHSINTAELSSIIEALSLGPTARLLDSQARIFHDSRHAASICLGTVHARTSSWGSLAGVSCHKSN